MLYAIHYEPQDFFAVASVKHLSVFSRVFVLDKGIAGLVYMCKDENNLYYCDRFYPSQQKESDYQKLDPYEVHQELYAKINLDRRLRMN